MARVSGEAHLDQVSRKYYYEIRSSEGHVLVKSEPEFESQGQAEAEMIALLQQLGQKARGRASDA